MENSAVQKTYALAATAANKKLAASLESAGGLVLAFPPIEIESITPNEKSVSLLKNLEQFDWLIFADVFAADYFLAALEQTGQDFYELDRLRVCALGEAVADRLRFVQIHSDVVPHTVDSSAVVESLTAYVGESEISDKNFLSIGKRSGENEIENRLKGKGAGVLRLEIYSAKILEASENARIKALFSGGAVDKIVFTSPADFFALEEFLPRPLFEELLRETKISSTDEVTAQFLRERNLTASLLRR